MKIEEIWTTYLLWKFGTSWNVDNLILFFDIFHCKHRFLIFFILSQDSRVSTLHQYICLNQYLLSALNCRSFQINFVGTNHLSNVWIEFYIAFFFYFRPKSFTNNFSNSVSFRSGANVEFSGPNFANTGVAESQGVSYNLYEILKI